MQRVRTDGWPRYRDRLRRQYFLGSYFQCFAPDPDHRPYRGHGEGCARRSQFGAQVSIENPATADKHSVTTDTSGNYSILQLPPGAYDVRISVPGFAPAVFHSVTIGLAQTSTINASLQIAQSSVAVTVSGAPPVVRSDSSELASTIDSCRLEALPLPTRNFLQLLTLVPGVTAPVTNNSAIGRNSPNVSVNGSRVTQNNYQINGVDGNDISLHGFADVLPESTFTRSRLHDSKRRSGNSFITPISSANRAFRPAFNRTNKHFTNSW